MAGLDIKGLNATALTDYAMQESKNASTIALQNKLQNTSKTSTDDELMEACKSFEAYFLEQMFKEMQKFLIMNLPISTNSQKNINKSFLKNNMKDKLNMSKK